MASRYLEDGEGGTYANPDYVDSEANPGDQQALNIQAAGYIPSTGWTGDQVNWSVMEGANGQKFGSEKEYFDWLYGPGGTYTDIGGEMYYMPPGGMGSFQPGTSPLVNATPDSKLGKLTLAGLIGLAGAGLGGALPGVEGAFGAAPTAAVDAALGVTPATAGEFSLAGGTGTAGNVAGTGGLSSTAGIHGLGAGVGTGGVGLGTGAAGLAATGTGSSALLTPTLAGAAGLATGGASAPTVAGGAATGGAATAPAAGTALSRILDGTATAADWLSIGGTGLSAVLSSYGANQQADAYRDVSDKWFNTGQWARDELKNTFSPTYSMANQPDFMNALNIGADAAARATSAKVGNPVDNPGAYAEIQKYISGSLALPQLNATRSQLINAGNTGTGAAASSDMAAAGQTMSKYSPITGAIGSLTAPDNGVNGVLSNLIKNSTAKGWGF